MMVDPTMPWKPVISGSTDLVTTPAITQAGFLEQVTAKTTAAIPYIERAMALKEALETVSDVTKLIELKEHRESIAAACGLSAKARGHLKGQEESLIRQTLTTLYEHTRSLYPDNTPDEVIAAAFRQQLVYRYLLTAGDTLGGSMRNHVGATGAAKLSKAILEALTAAGYHDVYTRQTPKGKITHIAWAQRLIVFDRTPTLRCNGGPVTCNNIDVSVLDASKANRLLNTVPTTDEEKRLLEQPSNYLACGELKSGIDPAGADEHWKTTLAALDRISQDFAQCGQHHPKLFFVGGAIESSMAEELYNRLSRGTYDFAANLTQPAQLQALGRWLITL